MTVTVARRISGITSIVFPLLLAVGCVTSQQDMMYLNDQVMTLNQRVEALETTVEQQAEMVAEMDAIRSEIQRLSGRVEDNNQVIRRTVERDTTDQDMMKAAVSDVTERVAVLEAELGRVYGYLGLESNLKQGKAPPSGAPGQPSAGEPPVPSTPSPPAGSGLSPEKARYEAMLNKYKNGDYEEAIAGFRDFLQKYPESELADNAQFWIGESHMGLKQYEQAILAYQEVIRKYAKGNKVPNAMLRQAVAFSELDDQTSAKLLLEKVIKQYPKSNEAKIAKTKLQTIQ